jgi:hypothetical protein
VSAAAEAAARGAAAAGAACCELLLCPAEVSSRSAGAAMTSADVVTAAADGFARGAGDAMLVRARC